MNTDVNRAVMHTEEVIARIRKLVALYAQVNRELSVVADQLAAIDRSAERMGVKPRDQVRHGPVSEDE